MKMMRELKILLTCCLLLGNIAWAGPLEAWQLMQAQHYTRQQQYAKALEAYEKITDKDDRMHYNMANLLYRQKRYKAAITQYMQITSPTLMHQKFHNIGNCLMQLGETASAVTFYRNALKFSPHPDTELNLSLARSILLQKEKEAQEKLPRESNETLAFRDGSNKIDRFKEENGSDDLKDTPAPKEIIKTMNATTTLQTRDGSKIDTETPTEENSTIIRQRKAQFDRYEAQRWKHFFERRSLKTLLIPLETQGVSHDQDPY